MLQTQYRRYFDMIGDKRINDKIVKLEEILSSQFDWCGKLGFVELVPVIKLE